MKWFVVVFALTPAVAAAQTIEVSGGVVIARGYDLGEQDALLTRNPSLPLTFFQTTSRVPGSAGAIARVGFRVRPRLTVEAAGELSHPEIRTDIKNDFESAAGESATLGFSQYSIGGSVVFDLGDARFTPFVFGGAAHVRAYEDEGDTVISGAEAHAGGGVRIALAPRLALRADVALSSRPGIGFVTRRRQMLVTSAGVTYRISR